MSTRKPPPSRSRHLRSRLVSPSRRLIVRYDMASLRAAGPPCRAGRLTAGAPVGGPPRDHRRAALDQRLAIGTSPAGPPVDPEPLLEAPLAAVGPDERLDRRPPVADRRGEH